MFGVWRTRDGDRLHGGGTFQYERLYVRVTPWRAILAATAVGAYLFGLILYLPAEAAVGASRQAVGTVWKGEAGLEPGFAAGWTLHPLRTLGGLAPAGEIAVRGPLTAVTGDAAWRRGSVVLDEADGVASLRLVNAVLPALPFACDGEMTVSARTLALTGGQAGQGRLRTGLATCAGGGVSSSPPPLTGSMTSDAEGASLSLASTTAGEVARVRATRGGATSLTITPSGAALLPGMAAATVEIR